MKRLTFILLLAALLALSTGAVAAQEVIAQTHAAGPVWAAWQPFQGGVMMWWSDTRQIWVMQNTGSVIVVPDIWVEGLPGPTGNPPVGFYVPTRGFGLVWQALSGQSTLGYAMAPEIGYDSAARIPSTNPGEIIIDGPGETLYAVSIPAGLNVGVWRVIRIG